MRREAAQIISWIWAAESSPYGLLVYLFVTIFVPAPLLSGRSLLRSIHKELSHV